ncbi:MAG TPA: long-chain fatty acid--CoA ligase [Anaeromyxobacteraceae bacterium]|nr:long-chain fatty acid--CoA ligase [Anaeromyxobacteraceae bacterium]
MSAPALPVPALPPAANDARGPELPFRTVPELLRRQAAALGGRTALQYRKQGAWVTLSYAAYYDRALMAARGLSRVGIRPGDRVAILSENRSGWVIADMGILAAGAVTVPIYPTNTPEQVAYVIEHSGARVVFVSSRAQYAKLVAVRDRIPGVLLAVSFERFLGDPALPLCTFYQLSEIDHPITPEERTGLEAGIDRVDAQDVATVIYTSGTTGVPKGATLTHRNLVAGAWLGRRHVPQLGDREVMLSCLPLSHVLERVDGYYMTLAYGCTLAFADSIEKVPENMREVRPTVMFGVPRLFEKIHARIFAEVGRAPGLKRRLFRWAVAVGRAHVRARYVERRRSPWLGLPQRLADRLVFATLRERFGGRVKAFVCGGAPLDPAINEFFWVAGLPILEGYGLTETCSAVTLNTFDAVRFGSVGRPLSHAEVRTDADGELLVRAPQVMRGYERDPAATAEAIGDGWLRTGDVGRIEDGFVFITDRKKELIITAGGKNIAPQHVEAELKRDRFVSQAFVHGDRRPYLTALLAPNVERLVEWAREHRIAWVDVDDLVINDAVVCHMTARVAAVNARLAPYEQVKRFVLLPREFSLEAGELSPALKMRRRVIYEKHREKFEQLYADAG